MKIVLESGRERLELQAAARLRLQWYEGLTPVGVSKEIERLKALIKDLNTT